MLLNQRCDGLCQSPAVGAIGRRIILLIDGPPTPHTGEGQLGAGQLQQLVTPAAQRLHDRTDQTPIASALADFGVLVQEAVGDQRHLARRHLIHTRLLSAVDPLARSHCFPFCVAEEFIGTAVGYSWRLAQVRGRTRVRAARGCIALYLSSATCRVFDPRMVRILARSTSAWLAFSTEPSTWALTASSLPPSPSNAAQFLYSTTK